MPLKPPTLPSPLPPRPKPHFGGEGIPTPISLKFPQSSSAGSAISPGGPSHFGGSSSLQGSAAGNTGHTDPIPSLLPPAGSKVRTFSDGLSSQRIKDNFGIKNLSINISENSSMPIWKEGVAYIKAGGTIFPVRTSRFANDGETWEIYSPSDPIKPGHAVKFEATGWKSNNNTGLQGGAPVDPRLAPYRAPDDLEEMRIEYLVGYKRDKVHEKISYDEGGRDAGYIKFVDGHHYRWRDFVSTGPLGERIVERRLVTQDQQIGPLLVLEEMTGLWALYWQQPGLSTAPKHPHSPDEAQALPPKRSRVDGEPLPPGGGMDVEHMPPELTHASEGFWENKRSSIRQLAANLFRDGKIRDVTYPNGGREINGTFNYGGNEYRFFFSGGTSKVTFQDMAGNSADPFSINRLYFAEFLRKIERRTPVPPIGGAPVPARPRSPTMIQNMPDNFSIPDELNPPAAEGFWHRIQDTTVYRTTAHRQTQFLLTELHRNGEIYGINFDIGTHGNPRLNAVMRYQGRDYNFSVGIDRLVRFASGSISPLGFNNRALHEVLEILASKTLP